jgi:transposase-like protein
MTTHDGIEPVSTERACRVTGENPPRNRPQPVRFSAQKKTEGVLRLLRGDDMNLLSRELQLPAACLATWRDAFLTGGQEALKKQPRDARDGEIARLREKLGEAPMANELLREKLAHVETGRPLRHGRSSR